MTWQLLAMTLAGAGVGAGIWIAVTPATAGPLEGPGPTSAWSTARARAWVGRSAGRRVLGGIAAGLVVLVLTRWVPVAVAVGAVVIAWPALFGAAGEQRAAIDRLEALAGWIEAVRDTARSHHGLPEALPAAAARVQSALAEPMREMLARMQAREPIEAVLRRLAEDIDDPIADAALAALILNARTAGEQLPQVLTNLAISTRREVESRRAIEAERSSTRRAVAIVLTVTSGLLVAMAVVMRDYSAPYATVSGQLVLLVVVGLFAAGLAVIRRLSRHNAPDRFLAADPASPPARPR